MLKLLSERIANEPDERVRANLELVRQHYLAEVAGDVEQVLSTLVADPQYRYLGSLLGASAPFDVAGREAVKAIYEQGVANGGIRHEYELSRVVADPAAVVTDGLIRHVFPGSLVSELAFAFVPEGEPDPDAWYLVEYPALVVWPVEPDGLLAGEHVYFGDKGRALRAVAPDEYPHLGPLDRSAAGRGSTSTGWA